MDGSKSSSLIHLADFKIRSPFPLPLALKFSVDGVDRKQMLNTHWNKESEIWEVDGDIKMRSENQLLTITVLVCFGGSTKELNRVAVNYSRLLAHAKARSKENYLFTLDGSSSLAPILVKCSIKVVSLPRKKTEVICARAKSKSNEADLLSIPSIANLERDYEKAVSLPSEQKSQALNTIGSVYDSMYNKTMDMMYLDRAISIRTEAVQNLSFHPIPAGYLNDVAVSLLKRFKRTRNRDDIDHAVSSSEDAVQAAEASDQGKPFYIINHAVALLERFECLGRAEDLHHAISSMEEVVKLTPDDHPGKPVYLSNLSSAFKARFDRLCSINDLDLAIMHQRKAVELTPDGHPDSTARLSKLGNAFHIRFTRLGRIKDLGLAIAHHRKAAELTPDGHSDKAALLSNLGNVLQARFDRLGDIKDLELAIVHMKQAVERTPDSDQGKPIYLNNLGNALQSLFNRLGRIEDLESTIMHCEKAVKLTQDGHPNRPELLSNLGTSLQMRFGHQDDIVDLELAIAHQKKAVELTLDGHPDKPIYLNNLAKALQSHFYRLGHIEDLELAITHIEKALKATPDDHTDKPGLINNLSDLLLMRFNRLGHIEDLELAIVHQRRAVELTPDDHSNKSGCLSRLGRAFNARFNRIGHIDDLQSAIMYEKRAVELTPEAHPEKPVRLGRLGSAFHALFNRLGRLEDLALAIEHQSKAVELIPDGHPDKPARLGNLGSAFHSRFKRLGHIEDLESAIVHEKEAVKLTPDDYPEKSTYLSSLGGVFEARFNRLGHIEDLELAIMHEKKAVELTLDDHPEKSRRLANLGSAFHSRFDRLRHIKDLEFAAIYQKKAVKLTPDGHPDKPAYLNNVGLALQARFNHLNHMEDLEVAIAHQKNALELMLDSHPDKPALLCNLGTAFEELFVRLNRVEDLEAAVIHHTSAVNLTPDGHQDKPRYLIMLGKAFVCRFDLQKRPEDAQAALAQFSIAASLPTGSPRVRLRAARDLALFYELLEDLGVPNPSPLETYHIAIGLLPRIAWLGIPITTQHALLKDVGGVVREAVSAAIKVAEYKTAVAWMEAGRSITWQNLLNLRPPLSELRSAHHDLANRLETISRQLDISVRESNGRIDVATDGTDVVPSPVQLALDWDNTVEEIRSKPGFELFLKPKSFDELKDISRDGPVIILNVNRDRCDALILILEESSGVNVTYASLPDFSYVKSEALLKELKQLLQSKNLRERNARPMHRKPHGTKGKVNLANILRSLWLDVAKPIVEALAYQPQPMDLPRIWWCATGPLAFLPIHAAGLYDTDEPGNKLSDYVVSSYTPTLSALLDDSSPIQEDLKLLAIAQANAMGASSIPKTEVEVKQIQNLGKNVNITTIMKGDATVENVWREMETSNWVHLACHGQQNITEPMKSGLLLHDGTLELQRLIEKPLPLADFAFLSACQTATGDESVAEESVHLAAGMLFAGYKGVIATMWSIMDGVGPRAAEDVYRVMLKDEKPDRKTAAHALHEAVRRLREDPKVDMVHWVPFIHIGR